MKNENKRMTGLVFFLRHIVPLVIVIIPLAIFARTGNIRPAFIYIGIGFLAYAAYLLVGYLMKWTHIYCYFQNIDRQPMTPDNVDWSTLRPGDGCITPALNAVLGVILLVFGMLGS